MGEVTQLPDHAVLRLHLFERARLIPRVRHVTPLATTEYRLSTLIIPFCHS
jgi:hypothetical protein